MARTGLEVGPFRFHSGLLKGVHPCVRRLELAAVPDGGCGRLGFQCLDSSLLFRCYTRSYLHLFPGIQGRKRRSDNRGGFICPQSGGSLRGSGFLAGGYGNLRHRVPGQPGGRCGDDRRWMVDLSCFARTGMSPPRSLYVAFFTVVGALVILKHRSNIARLLNGTEHSFYSKKSK